MEYADVAHSCRNSEYNLGRLRRRYGESSGSDFPHGTGYIRVIRCMINRLISGSVMAARFQSVPIPRSHRATGLRSAATVSPNEASTIPLYPQRSGWFAGWYGFSNWLLIVPPVAIVRFRYGSFARARERKQWTFQRKETRLGTVEADERRTEFIVALGRNDYDQPTPFVHNVKTIIDNNIPLRSIVIAIDKNYYLWLVILFVYFIFETLDVCTCKLLSRIKSLYY